MRQLMYLTVHVLVLDLPMTPGIRPYAHSICPICLVSATETRTRYGHENLRRRAVDFRKVAVDFRNGGVAGQMGQALNKPRKWSNHGTTGNKNGFRQVGAATFFVKPIPN